MAAGTLLADKAFDADARVIEPLLARGKSVVIPPRAPQVQRDFDKDAYKARHLIENFFCKLSISCHRHPLRQNRQNPAAHRRAHGEEA